MQRTQSMPFFAWLNWFIVTSFVLYQFFLQISAGVMASLWMHSFDISLVGVGNLSAAFFYSYVLAQLPVGMLLDKYNTRYVLTFAAITLAGSCFLLAFTKSYHVALFARIIMGLGGGFGFVGMLHICANWFSHKQFPFMVSLAETLGTLGVACIEVILAWLVIVAGWRATIDYAGMGALVLALAIFLFVRDNKKEVLSKRETSIFYTLVLAAKDKQVWLAGLYGFCMSAVINAFASLWGIPFLSHAYHLNLHTAARMVAMIFIGVGLGTIANSFISLRMNRRKPVLIFNALCAGIMLGIVVYIPNIPYFLIYGLLFFAGFFASAYILTFAVTKESVPAFYRATALALVNMILMSSALLLQPLLGYLIDIRFFHLTNTLIQSYRLAIGLLPIAMWLSIFFALLMKETYCSSYDPKAEVKQVA